MRRAGLGDIVRILSTADTVAAGYADRTGKCHGFTTPSVTGVQMIGPATEDVALNVDFGDGESGWFDPSLVIVVDVDAGQTASIGDKWFVRAPNGDWIEAPDPN